MARLSCEKNQLQSACRAPKTDLFVVGTSLWRELTVKYLDVKLLSGTYHKSAGFGVKFVISMYAT